MPVSCTACNRKVHMQYVRLVGGRMARSGRCPRCGVYYCSRGHQLYDDRKAWGRRKDQVTGEVRPYPYCVHAECGRTVDVEDWVRRQLADKATDLAALRAEVQAKRDAALVGSWQRKVLSRLINEHRQLWVRREV